MGFDFSKDSGLTDLEDWLKPRSYIHGYNPSQADVTVHKSVEQYKDKLSNYPHISRWTRHITSHSPDHAKLPGDASKDHTAYGPENVVAAAAAPEPAKDEKADESDDLFGSDSEEEDPEVTKAREQRLAEYKKKNEGKAKPAAKSIVTIDVKPWDDETNMDDLTTGVLAIEMDGLVWGGHQLIAVGYGIKKLQINVVIEDDKVSLEDLQEEIARDEEHVQSTDIAAMQKL